VCTDSNTYGRYGTSGRMVQSRLLQVGLAIQTKYLLTARNSLLPNFMIWIGKIS
jgi:hypothetical protein